MVQEQYGGATFDDDKGVQVYPPNKRRLSFKVPAVVEASYLEAVRCEGNQAWIATAAMVGRTLEAACKDEEPKSKSMFEGLQKLRKAGKISDELCSGLINFGSSGIRVLTRRKRQLSAKMQWMRSTSFRRFSRPSTTSGQCSRR